MKKNTLNNKRVSIKDIAMALNISGAAVSRALNNDPKISKKRKLEVKEKAAELGYIKDALTTALCQYRWGHEKDINRGTIAWIESTEQENNDHHKLFTEVCNNAKELGFTVERFNAYANRMNPKRLQQILDARGILGLILAPTTEESIEFQMDWEKFSVIQMGHSKNTTLFHSATTCVFESMNNCLEQLSKLSYRRIGYVYTESDTAKYRSLDLGAYSVANLRASQPPLIHALSFKDQEEISSFGGLMKLKDWIEKNGIDAVIGSGIEIQEMILESVHEIPEELGYASLNQTTEDPKVSGMEQDNKKLAETGIHILQGLIKNNEKGIPSSPRSTSIKAIWNTGSTLRDQVVNDTQVSEVA
jgi:DNA-binding LacI/PurR family transcriptional regulator